MVTILPARMKMTMNGMAGVDEPWMIYRICITRVAWPGL